jgi:hemerythrin
MLSWTKSLSVGVEDIDNKNKELFSKINELFIVMREGEGKAQVLKVLDTLEVYVDKYFQEEEKIQLEKQYPVDKYNIHHSKHEEFKAELKNVRRTFEATGVSAIFVISTEQRIISWWKHHIEYMDKELVEFLITNKVAAIK